MKAPGVPLLAWGLVVAGAGGACTPISTRAPADESSGRADQAAADATTTADELFAYYPEARRLQIGEQVPDIELRDAGGRTLTLRTFRGRVVVLAFVGASAGNDNDTEMMRRFGQLGAAVGPELAEKMHLLTMVIDDTAGSAAVPRAQAVAPAVDVPWTFIGAHPRDAALLAAAFGVVLWQYADGGTGHTFNTVVIDPEGRLADHFPGLDAWSPLDVIAAASVAAGH